MYNVIDIFYALLIFFTVLFLYIHIQFHLKKSDDLEIYEVEDLSKDSLEDICDVRQPVLIKQLCEDLHNIIKHTNKSYIIEHYPAFDVNVKQISGNSAVLPVPLHSLDKLFESDIEGKSYSECNTEFLEDTTTIKHMKYNDSYLRPHLVSNCHYDILLGSERVKTPLKYELNYRNYLLVTQGNVTIKLAPPKYSKYLHTISDYEHFEFTSPINIWEPQDKYKADFDKVKCLEIKLELGQLLFIPAYWWYSIHFSNDSSISCFKYRTPMNNLAICPQLIMYALQNQNVEFKMIRSDYLGK